MHLIGLLKNKWNEQRIYGWQEYINSIDTLSEWVFGGKISSLPFSSTRLEGSLHNSYLMLHARIE